MVTLRFPFSFPPRPPSGHGHNASSGSSSSAAARLSQAMAAAAMAAAGIGMALALSARCADDKPWLSGPAAHAWASVSLADGAFVPTGTGTGTGTGTAVEPKTGAAFPTLLEGGRRLLGIGLRRKNLLGLKSIDVYAFGVYADDTDVRKLNKKYGKLSASELEGNAELTKDVLDQDLCMTIRLQIVYGSLSIRSVRSTFEKTVGSRLQKFSGSDERELLQRFTSIFKDEYKVPRGSVIELSREKNYVLQTRIDGQVVGSIQSKLLCQSVLDLYLGDDPLDRRAKEDIHRGLASILHESA